MSLRVINHNNGLIVLDDNQPILVRKGLNFKLPAAKVRITGVSDIPTKEVLRVAICVGITDVALALEQLGHKYSFKYVHQGIVNNSLVYEEETFHAIDL